MTLHFFAFDKRLWTILLEKMAQLTKGITALRHYGIAAELILGRRLHRRFHCLDIRKTGSGALHVLTLLHCHTVRGAWLWIVTAE
tara:strand:- start:4063 stop:4317 length:255 start_codon:yes stop_codon:yes gene_type:complete